MELSTGSQEIVGVLTGVKMDFSESECTNGIWESKLIVFGQLSKKILIGSILMRKFSLVNLES
jgi:hypothetical protein